MTLDTTKPEDYKIRTRRTRCDSTRGVLGSNGSDNLELSGVLAALKGLTDIEGGINCRVCGKLYKSRVCLTKHVWEHSVYWEMFPGTKNHERVLSIQAALILWNQQQQHNERAELDELLVTSPQKKEREGNENDSGNLLLATPTKSSLQYKPQLKGKRKLLMDDTNILKDFPPSHSDMGSPSKMTRQC